MIGYSYWSVWWSIWGEMGATVQRRHHPVRRNVAAIGWFVGALCRLCACECLCLCDHSFGLFGRQAKQDIGKASAAIRISSINFVISVIRLSFVNRFWSSRRFSVLVNVDSFDFVKCEQFHFKPKGNNFHSFSLSDRYYTRINSALLANFCFNVNSWWFFECLFSFFWK